MMKKAVYGKCHICGEYGELSFEHIPPEAALNKGQVKAYSGEEILKTFHGERARYLNMQRGMGRFSLCKSCNNTTGQWYAATYCQVAKEVASSRSKAEQLQHGDCIEYTFKNLLRNFPYCCENIDTECNGQRCIRCLFSFYCRA